MYEQPIGPRENPCYPNPHEWEYVSHRRVHKCSCGDLHTDRRWAGRRIPGRKSEVWCSECGVYAKGLRREDPDDLTRDRW